ncbi:Wat1-related protein [Thalictrum thalictroides]|uniref:Wat1-related protein n=1 Tax=Thalictrum thalictroides TaxID=46969 RepID=A0A7J6W313_THATH|nr:Wat1-related protein [Thalictrum thalictroides]
MRRSSSQAKYLGTIISISGAFIVTLYKGPPIIIIPSHSDLPNQLLLSPKSNWVFGSLLLASSCLLSALWKIYQTATMKEYPSERTVVFFYCFFGTIQCAIYSLIVEKDPNAWKLKPGLELVAILYSAIFGSIFHNLIHTWGLHKKGV